MDSPFTVKVSPPRGTFVCKVDDKGRLKLAAPLHHFLLRLGAKEVWVTSLDEVTACIYSPEIWERNEELMMTHESASDVNFIAQHYGADSDVDLQGRILLPEKLRKHLQVEGATVHLQHFRGHIAVYPDAYYQNRLTQARQGLSEKVKALEGAGLL